MLSYLAIIRLVHEINMFIDPQNRKKRARVIHAENIARPQVVHYCSIAHIEANMLTLS